MSDTRVKIKLIQQILYDGWFCAGEQLRSNFSFIVMKSWIIRKRSWYIDPEDSVSGNQSAAGTPKRTKISALCYLYSTQDQENLRKFHTTLKNVFCLCNITYLLSMCNKCSFLWKNVPTYISLYRKKPISTISQQSKMWSNKTDRQIRRNINNGTYSQFAYINAILKIKLGNTNNTSFIETSIPFGYYIGH